MASNKILFTYPPKSSTLSDRQRDFSLKQPIQRSLSDSSHLFADVVDRVGPKLITCSTMPKQTRMPESSRSLACMRSITPTTRTSSNRSMTRRSRPFVTAGGVATSVVSPGHVDIPVAPGSASSSVGCTICDQRRRGLIDPPGCTRIQQSEFPIEIMHLKL